MLPGFPDIVSARSEWNRSLMKSLVQQKSPILAEIASHKVHEGEVSDIVRVDGSEDRTDMQRHSGNVDITITDISEFNEAKVMEYIDNIAEQFAESMTKSVFSTVNEGAEKVGNVIDGKGKPFSPELLLEALDRIELDFAPDGTWNPPTMVVSPAQAESLKIIRETSDESQYESRFKDIIERKKSEHSRREAGRVLAG